MTAPLGSPICPFVGCGRRRHESSTGIRYGTCLAHARDLVARAFGEPRIPAAPASERYNPPALARRRGRPVPAGATSA